MGSEKVTGRERESYCCKPIAFSCSSFIFFLIDALRVTLL